MTKLNHTSTPWEITIGGAGYLNISNGSFFIAAVGSNAEYYESGKQKGNAELIVKAVNNHEALILLLEKILLVNGGTMDWLTSYISAHPSVSAFRDAKMALADMQSAIIAALIAAKGAP